MARRLWHSLTIWLAVLTALGLLQAAAQATSEASHWDGPTRVTPRAPHQVRALDCATPTGCTAVDESGQALRFDGKRWSAPTPAARDRGPLTSVSCPTSSMCAAVGGPRVARRNGKHWHLTASHLALDSVSCPSDSFCLAVTRAGRTLRFADERWRSGPRLRFSTPDRAIASEVSCASRRLCVVVDTAGVAHALRAGRWAGIGRVVAKGASPGRALDCGSTTFCMASSGQLASRWNGRRWTSERVTGGTPGFESSLSCSGSHFCMLVNDAGGSFTWNGTWHARATIGTVVGFGRAPALSCSGRRRCLTVFGESSSDPVWSYDDGWQHEPSYGPRQLDWPTVSCPTAGFCMSFDGRGHSHRLTSGHWRATPTPHGGSGPTAVSCISAAFCAAVLPSGDATLWDGTAWSPVTHLSDQNRWQVACASSAYCVATGGDYNFAGGNTTFVWSGSAWSPSAASARAVLSLSCPAARDCWASNLEGYVEHFDGTAWGAAHFLWSRDEAGALSLICPTRSFCAVADHLGNVAFRRDGHWGREHHVHRFGALSCAGPRSCTLAPLPQHPGKVSRWDGHTWVTGRGLPRGYQGTGEAFALSCPTASICSLLDPAGNAYRRS